MILWNVRKIQWHFVQEWDIHVDQQRKQSLAELQHLTLNLKINYHKLICKLQSLFVLSLCDDET